MARGSVGRVVGGGFAGRVEGGERDLYRRKSDGVIGASVAFANADSFTGSDTDTCRGTRADAYSHANPDAQSHADALARLGAYHPGGH